MTMIISEIVDRLNQNAKEGRLKFPTLPEIVFRINSVIDDDSKSIVDIAAVVQEHPVLTVRLLNVANSPILNTGVYISSLEEAIKKIGISLIKSLSISLALKDKFKIKDPEYRHALEEVWHHSVDVGAHCYIFAKHLDNPKIDPNIALIVGIVHSIGAIPVIDYFADNQIPSEYLEEVCNQVAKSISRQSLLDWGLPSSIVKGACFETVYGSILSYVHSYKNKIDIEHDFDLDHEEFEKVLEDNKRQYNDISNLFK